MPKVLLFKTKESCKTHHDKTTTTTTTTEDEYQLALARHNYNVNFIPVLDSKSESVTFIQQLLAKPPPTTIGSIIFTSQRSVDTWAIASSNITVHPQWRSLHVFIVGTKTAEKLTQLGFFHGTVPTIVKDRAVQLADAMIPFLLQQQGGKQGVLFLAGDKRMNELPTRLTKANIPFQEVRAYSTCAHPDLTQRLLSSSQAHGLPDWAVFFSPSGVNYVLERNPELVDTIPKLAAIGATTAEHMHQRGLSVAAVASKPRALELAAAIAEHDHDQ
ncbi:tetrapyrrole biosynthesis, uroporphyrinogen III synthase [Zychaea mexicana]|uniref:tetrapyrrole biosynthesis, uroporphyrinogen III synthase n=1 Tax=Zychaea mexicana TaxID=64656 RepID=UPI0022FDE52A|nr:tetrapyrrole biosynthesis, uroporphyrinogen III synthase [Zychaea mexicana]KAI9490026.1 tetrapyrrole biosynthesis, uroporphyrinogen III synthase [Zychaea mexicana]